MAGWEPLSKLVHHEIQLATEDGRDLGNPQTWQDKLCNAGEDEDALNQLMDQLLALPERNDDPFDEPSELDAIKRLRPAGISLPPCTLSDEHLYDRLYGAWLGRCCGCALGKPVEPFMGKHNGLSRSSNKFNSTRRT